MMKTVILTLIFSISLFSQEIVKLKLPKSNKVVIKLMFQNGSISDPEGKQGLTVATVGLITQGGTADMTYSDIQNAIYPMAANYFGTVDKEVTVFTFEVHTDFLENLEFENEY